MRYIGNKTKLLPAIDALLAERGLADGSGRTFFDIFAGTASVARHMKERGFRVVSNDRLRASWVRQKALVEASSRPRGLLARLEALVAAPGVEGLVTRQFSPAGKAGRRFFTVEHAARIDAALEMLTACRASGEADERTICILLCALLEAADRVANISGTYGAFLKTWQPNTRAPLALRLSAPVRSRRRSRAYREDALAIAPRVACDVLYIDPPYNTREYAANYHVLEAIAERPFRTDLAALEAEIYGKSGLRPYERSAFCDRARCEDAFRALIATSRAREVIVSYNEEGILTRAQIVAALAEGLSARPRDVLFREIRYRRFRSDKDGERRSYATLAGRARDEVAEWLVCARRGPISSPRRRGVLTTATPRP
jgi:adenine-specific DNA-methyltransferase